MWRFAPFYIALAGAPLLFGGVKPESQAVLGILLASGLWLTRPFAVAEVLPRWLKAALLVLVLLSVTPLPFAVVKVLCPERARLAAAFPIDLAAPKWLALSISPARTAQRLYEIALAMAAFILARRSAGKPGGSRRMAWALAIGLVFLGLSDVWSGEHGRESVLGLWTISWGKGAGTYANHNHFANWIYVAAVFCGGWILHERFRRDRKANRWELIAMTIATAFGLVMAFLAASRSGSIAFVCGATAFALSIRTQLRRKSFALAASVLLIGAVVVGLLAGEPLVHRFQRVSSSTSLLGKTEIWRDTARVLPPFALFGAGAGTFARVFDHYKTDHGDSTFSHAENDWIELFLEYGIPGALLICLGLALVLRSAFGESISPLGAGALGALVVFAVHAGGEFVAHIPANLMLAAALAGFASGRSIIPNSQAATRNPQVLAWLLIVVSALQGFAWWNSWQAARSDAPLPLIERSLAAWPFAVNRHIGELRAVAKENPNPARAAVFDARVNRALQLDPLNWELRVEQTWFDLAYSTDTTRTLSNAWLTVRLNPLQGEIPLRYARHFARRDPDLALNFLAAVHPGIPAHRHDALELAWNITHDPAQLWKLTPNTVPSLRDLIRVALEQKLYPIAAQACQLLEGRIDMGIQARLYFKAQRPDQALRFLEKGSGLRIQALTQMGRTAEAIEESRELFARYKSISESTFQPTTSFSALLTNYQRTPKDPAAALLLAEKCAAMEPTEFPVLSNLAAAFPNEPRIAYLLFQSQVAAGQSNAAAETASFLVDRLPAK